MQQALRDFMRAFDEWIGHQDHKDFCGAGTIIQSGPAEGNKVPCTCGLSDLIAVSSHVVNKINNG